jgi:hypothetical protein
MACRRVRRLELGLQAPQLHHLAMIQRLQKREFANPLYIGMEKNSEGEMTPGLLQLRHGNFGHC